LSDSVAVGESYAYTKQHRPNVRQPFMFHYCDVLGVFGCRCSTPRTDGALELMFFVVFIGLFVT
jgi:hypothetical protein